MLKNKLFPGFYYLNLFALSVISIHSLINANDSYLNNLFWVESILILIVMGIICAWFWKNGELST